MTTKPILFDPSEAEVGERSVLSLLMEKVLKTGTTHELSKRATALFHRQFENAPADVLDELRNERRRMGASSRFVVVR